MLFDILIIIGSILIAITVWFIYISRDPLGYFPPNALTPGSIGSILIIIGLIGKGVMS